MCHQRHAWWLSRLTSLIMISAGEQRLTNKNVFHSDWHHINWRTQKISLAAISQNFMYFINARVKQVKESHWISEPWRSTWKIFAGKDFELIHLQPPLLQFASLFQCPGLKSNSAHCAVQPVFVQCTQNVILCSAVLSKQCCQCQGTLSSASDKTQHLTQHLTRHNTTSLLTLTL